MNGELKSEAVAEDGREDSIVLNIPPLGAVVVKRVIRNKSVTFELN